MTTIAYDGKILAADTLVTCGPGGGVLFNPARKICRLPNGDIVGVAGSMAMAELILLWLEREIGDLFKPPPVFPGQTWQAIEITKYGVFFRCHTDPQRCAVNVPAAIGSGGPYALGAMLAGKSAQESVAIAARCDAATGGDIDIIEVQP